MLLTAVIVFWTGGSDTCKKTLATSGGYVMDRGVYMQKEHAYTFCGTSNIYRVNLTDPDKENVTENEYHYCVGITAVLTAKQGAELALQK